MDGEYKDGFEIERLWQTYFHKPCKECGERDCQRIRQRNGKYTCGAPESLDITDSFYYPAIVYYPFLAIGWIFFALPFLVLLSTEKRFPKIFDFLFNKVAYVVCIPIYIVIFILWALFLPYWAFKKSRFQVF